MQAAKLQKRGHARVRDVCEGQAHQKDVRLVAVERCNARLLIDDPHWKDSASVCAWDVCMRVCVRVCGASNRVRHDQNVEALNPSLTFASAQKSLESRMSKYAHGVAIISAHQT